MFDVSIKALGLHLYDFLHCAAARQSAGQVFRCFCRNCLWVYLRGQIYCERECVMLSKTITLRCTCFHHVDVLQPFLMRFFGLFVFSVPARISVLIIRQLFAGGFRDLCVCVCVGVVVTCFCVFTEAIDQRPIIYKSQTWVMFFPPVFVFHTNLDVTDFLSLLVVWKPNSDLVILFFFLLLLSSPLLTFFSHFDTCLPPYTILIANSVAWIHDQVIWAIRAAFRCMCVCVCT